MLMRIFRTGGLVKFLAILLKIVSYSLLSSFKNEGCLLPYSLFDSVATIPAIIFEMLWVCCMEAKVI